MVSLQYQYSEFNLVGMMPFQIVKEEENVDMVKGKGRDVTRNEYTI